MPVNAAGTIDSSILAAINGGAAADKSASGDLRDNFMTLLVAQLKNQNPMNPMENADLTSQLAQINTLSSIENLNTTLEGINQQVGAGQTMQAAALIGKGVMVPGSRALLGSEGSSTPFGIDLAQSADDVHIDIVDGSGSTVRSFDLGQQPSGVQTLQWDGVLNNGNRAAQGAYRVVVNAQQNDELLSPVVLNYNVVSGVTPGSSGPMLDLGGVADPVELGDIRQIL